MRIGAADAPRKVLVVGSIHGNEGAGIAVTRTLRSATAPPGVQLLLVDRANPDGSAAGTRGNAHGVDLNRNFPWRWRHLGGVYYSGPRPASEPETRVLKRFILRERPAVSIWFHQHLNFVILQPGGDQGLTRRYARVAHMRAGTYPQVPGGVARWENHALPSASAFVVELAAGRYRPDASTRTSAPYLQWRPRAREYAQTSLRSLRSIADVDGHAGEDRGTACRGQEVVEGTTFGTRAPFWAGSTGSRKEALTPIAGEAATSCGSASRSQPPGRARERGGGSRKKRIALRATKVTQRPQSERRPQRW